VIWLCSEGKGYLVEHFIQVSIFARHEDSAVCRALDGHNVHVVGGDGEERLWQQVHLSIITGGCICSKHKSTNHWCVKPHSILSVGQVCMGICLPDSQIWLSQASGQSLVSSVHKSWKKVLRSVASTCDLVRLGEADAEQHHIDGRGEAQQPRDVRLEDPRPRLHQARRNHTLTQSIKVRQVTPETHQSMPSHS
jgi:hypothetical protein